MGSEHPRTSDIFSKSIPVNPSKVFEATILKFADLIDP